MAFTPAQVVPAPEPRGLRYGLLTAAAGPLDLPAHGGSGGVQYDPVSCGFARNYPVECDSTPPLKVFDAGDEYVAADPFVAYATYICGAAGSGGGAALEAKVRRRLANGEQSVVEAALAAELAAAATPVTPPLTTALEAVVGELEQWLYGTSAGQAAYGNVGYLHAPVRAQAYAAEAGLIVRDGPLLRTHMGTVWVFGGGYPDNGTLYISGHVTVWRDPDVFVSPAPQVFNTLTNEYRLVAERAYAVAYDCVAAAGTFDTEAPS